MNGFPSHSWHALAALLMLAGLGMLLAASPAAAQVPATDDDSTRAAPPAAERDTTRRDTSQTRRVEIIAPSDSLVQGRDPATGTPQRRLVGNVRLRQGTTLLYADRATQYLTQDEILFTGDVLIIDEGDSLWADRVRYDSRQKIGRATGDVRVSSGGEVLLAGPVGRYDFERKHARFPERVTMVDSARVLKSYRGEYFSNQERAEFYRDVRVFSDSTYLEADSVTYLRDSEVSEARGQVFIERRGDGAQERERDAPPEGGSEDARDDTTRADITRAGFAETDTVAARARRPQLLGRPLPVDTTRRALLPDTTARALLWGDYAYNDPQAGYSRVTGRALLVRLQPPDSSRAGDTTSVPTRAEAGPTQPPPDTLIVRARQLETVRSDTLRRLTATESVRLWQQDLQAVADSSVYDRWPAAAPSASGERTDSTQSGSPRRTRRQETRLFDEPLSWSNGGSDGGGSSAQLSGDSLRVTGRGGRLRRLFARGNAFLAQEDSVLAGRLQQLKGRRLTGRFTQSPEGETTLRRLSAGPNAEAIYFQKNEGAPPDSALAGAVRVSSDSIVFRMRDGALEKMRVLGGVQGRRYEAQDVPEPFQLDGLTWLPERRPRKRTFLTEERVRRRLTRPPVPSPPAPDDRLPPPPTDDELPPTAQTASG